MQPNSKYRYFDSNHSLAEFIEEHRSKRDRELPVGVVFTTGDIKSPHPFNAELGRGIIF